MRAAQIHRLVCQMAKANKTTVDTMIVRRGISSRTFRSLKGSEPKTLYVAAALILLMEDTVVPVPQRCLELTLHGEPFLLSRRDASPYPFSHN